MNRFRTITAAALTSMGIIAAGFVSIPTEGNAGVASVLTPTQRIDATFAALADVDPARLALSSEPATRTVLAGYQTDLTEAVLLRKPGV
jgi:hypothetical protein